jgi:teichuronic acid exporter
MTSIRKSLGSGIIYTAIAKYSGVFFSVFIGAVLARLLSPEEFGIVALVTVFVTFFNLLSNFGIVQAVIQNQLLTEEDIQSIFSFSILLAILLAGLFFIAAPFISKFYNEPELINISKWLALSVLFNSLQIIPKGIFQKALKFKQIGIVTIIVQVICGIIAIILAYRGFSYYALVVQSILNGLFSLIVFYYLAPIKISLRIKKESINKIIRFSSFNFLFNFINYFSRNGDNLLIGKFFGSAQLGFYDKSYRLMLLPIQNLTSVVTSVLMPVLSKYQDDKEIVYNTYLKVVKIMATIGFPLSIFLFFSSSEIINIVYGPQWGQSIPVFKIIALSVGIQIIYSSAGSIFQVVNRTDLLFYYGLIGATVLLSGISIGVFWGKTIEAVGYGLLVSFSINFFVVFYMLIGMALKKSYTRFLKTIIYPVFISIVISFPLWLYSQHELENIYLSFGIKIVITGFTFLLLFFFKKENRIIFQKGIKGYIKS